MGRKFIAGFATTLVLVALGTRIHFRGPDQAGPGEETVSIHGITIFHREVDRDMMRNHSPYPALWAMALGALSFSTLGGCIWVLVAKLQKPVPASTFRELP